MTEGMISVIIPVYNSAPYLELCLESVLLQKDVNLEILLINDGSIDYSNIICQEYAGKYPMIRYFQKEHTGAAASRNLGIGFAEGEYLFFLDSDDYLLDGTLGKLLNGIQKVDLTIGEYKYQNRNKRMNAEEIKNEGVFFPVDAVHLSSVTGNKLYRTELIQEFDVLFPILRVGETLTFFHNYLSVCQTVSMIQDPIFVYRTDENSMSRGNGTETLDYLKAFEQIERAYRNQPAMKREFAYDELTCIKNYIQQLYHYEDKRERLLLFDKYRAAAACIPEGTNEAEKIRKWILQSSKYFYCGTTFPLLCQKIQQKLFVSKKC